MILHSLFNLAFQFWRRGQIYCLRYTEIIEMFELHASIPGMWSAEYQGTIPLELCIIKRMFRQSTNQNHYPVFGLWWRHWTSLTAGRFRCCWEEKMTRSNQMKFRLVNMRYWPSVRSRWLDIGQVLFLRLYHKKERGYLSFSHHDRTHLVNKGFIVRPKRQRFPCGTNGNHERARKAPSRPHW